MEEAWLLQASSVAGKGGLFEQVPALRLSNPEPQGNQGE